MTPGLPAGRGRSVRPDRSVRPVRRLVESLLLAACLAAGCFVVSCPTEARAQGGSAAADSIALQEALKASNQAIATAYGKGRMNDPDRIEFGVAMPEDYFDWLGTFAYRRRVRTTPQFEHSLHVEGTYGHKDYLSEGSISLGWYVRPTKFWHPEWTIRPILEGGIAGYAVVQFADIVGFDDWSSHAKAFVKGHGVAGVEASLSDRWGVELRGRITVPAHRPLDYAQLALFFR